MLQLLVIRRGMETVRKFQDWAGPAIWFVMFLLAAWIVFEAGSDFSLTLSHRPEARRRSLSTPSWSRSR